MMQTAHKIVQGDSRQMSLVPDESVHLIVTSPPYWQLKDYGVEGQIGFDDSYEVYINNLNLVWQECNRVLHPGCRLCVNIGDQFARAVYYGRYKVIPIRTEIIKFCEAIGMDYMGAVIWQKVTTTNTTGGASIMGSFPYPRNGILKLDYEFILLFKKLGDAPKPSREQKDAAKMTTEEWNQYFAGHWNFPGEKQEGHIAKFPLELPHRLIRMFSFPGETVLDPFMGSGTTNVAAARLNRNSVGYEINSEFSEIARGRLQSENTLTQRLDIERVSQRQLELAELILQRTGLSHPFADCVKVAKKTDPRALSFGSKITGGEIKDKGVKVCSILGANLLEIEGGQVLRLLGVMPIVARESEAMEVLSKTLKGQRIHLKFDQVKYDDNGRLLAYVFLENKTFVNGHLLRTGSVALDQSIPLLKSVSLRNFAGEQISHAN